MIKPCTTVRTPPVSQKTRETDEKLGDTCTCVPSRYFREQNKFKFLNNKKLFNYCYYCTKTHTEYLPRSRVH